MVSTHPGPVHSDLRMILVPYAGGLGTFDSLEISGDIPAYTTIWEISLKLQVRLLATSSKLRSIIYLYSLGRLQA